MMINDALLRAIGWALAHSIWQGTLAALMLLVLLPRLKTARRRYWAAYGTLAAVFVSALFTGIWMYDPALAETAAFAEVLDEAGFGMIYFTDNEAFSSSYWILFSDWLERNHSLIVVLWFLGFGFFLLRMGGGLWQIRRLRREGISMPAAPWLERFDALQQRLGLARVVQLLESTLVQTPTAIGFLKPVVLLPLGLVNQLSVAEVEAVLAHELAHIARKDWVFNLLQAFIESLFYYHPAVWWISSAIRRERENCCDDTALALTGNPLAFAKALVQVQEIARPAPALALGLSTHRRHPLLERVRRILNQPQQKQHQVMEKITATVILLALFALVGLKANSVPSIEAVFSQISDIPSAIFGDKKEASQIAQDTVPKPKNTRKITREEDDEVVEAEYQNGKLTRLKINGDEIPEASFSEHKALIEELEVEVLTPPTPPSPPSAPRGLWHSEDNTFWEVPSPPSPPGAPRSFYFHSDSPEAPNGLFPSGSRKKIKVYSDEDEEGNTVIRLDNNGERTEVIVKDNDVYINGKRLEKGEGFEIKGLGSGRDNRVFFSPDGYNFHLENGGSSDHERALLFEHLKESRGNSEELVRELKMRSKEMTEQKQDIQRELVRAKRAMERDQRGLEKEQRLLEREQKQLLIENGFFESRHNNVENALKKSLLADGLISNPDKFSLDISEKSLRINKKKQSAEMHRKYMKLLEKTMGYKMEGKSKFHFNFTDED